MPIRIELRISNIKVKTEKCVLNIRDNQHMEAAQTKYIRILLGFAIQPLEENMQNDPTTLKKTVAT
jgi:hypothetical protein